MTGAIKVPIMCSIANGLQNVMFQHSTSHVFSKFCSVGKQLISLLPSALLPSLKISTRFEIYVTLGKKLDFLLLCTFMHQGKNMYKYLKYVCSKCERCIYKKNPNFWFSALYSRQVQPINKNGRKQNNCYVHLNN